jgi:hypothetical protein
MRYAHRDADQYGDQYGDQYTYSNVHAHLYPHTARLDWRNVFAQQPKPAHL